MLKEILILAISTLLSGGIASLATLRYTRQKSQAEAEKMKAEVKTTELDNVQDAIKIWRETTEKLREELNATHSAFNGQIESLRKEIVRLTNVQNKILKLLDKITSENLDKMVEQIKSEIHENN